MPAGRDIWVEIQQVIGAIYTSPAPRAFSYRGIAGVPPTTDQSTIQPRTHLVEAIYTQLIQSTINAVALTGIGGIGKSTLAALLFWHTEAQQSTGEGFFQAPPLWLSIDQTTTFADVIGTIFQRLDQSLSVLDNLSPAGQVEVLFTLLDTLALPRLIVLDQFDNLLDWTTGRALSTQPGVGELIDALNSRPWKSSCRLLLTSRPFPKGMQVVPPICFHECAVGGLTLQEGLALLRSPGIQATEADLQKAVTFCDGHPLSLVLLIALIPLYGPLADLLTETTLWVGDIATNLLDAVFQRLTEEQRTVLRALSVYRTAVPVAALAAFLMGSSSQQILLSFRPLLVQRVIQLAGNGRYQVHAIVTRYVQMHFVEGDQQANQQALRAAYAKAAHYYLEQAQVSALPREQRRGVNDIQGIIEAIWQYTQAAQWQKAYALVEQEQLLSDLNDWGGYVLLLNLCQWFLPQTEWQPEPKQTITIYLYLGRAYLILGNPQQALKYYQQVLNILRELGDRRNEGATLSNIGSVYDALGNKQRALEYYQQALAIHRELGDCRNEGATLGNVGGVYDALGNPQQALEYYQQALTIHRELGDRRNEGATLSNIGRVYDALGNPQQALKYYQQALSILRELGDRRNEGTTLSNIGSVYDTLGNKQLALEHYQQALTISREVGDREGEGATQWNIGALALDQHHYDFALAALLIARQCFKEVSSPLQNEVERWIGLLRQAIGPQLFAALQEYVEPRMQQIVEQGLGAKHEYDLPTKKR